ncbi:MAG TPA: mechanosensitive ion channel domain-containing protein [Candidatus Acidoferrales bacterium]
MKNYEKLIWQSLLALLAILLCAAIFTRGWANYRDRLRALRAKSQHAQMVDTRPLDTAQQLGALAVMRTEHDYAQDAERLADRSVDLAFAIAIHDAGRNPAPLTPQTRQLTERIKTGETAVTGDQARVAQFTQLLAKTSDASAKADLQGLLVTAQAQFALDQDDLDAANQDLVLAGGNKQAAVQQLLDQHKAQDAQSAATAAAADAAAAASGVASIERTQSRSIVAEFRAWNSLHTKELQLIQAQKEAQTLAAQLLASRDQVQKELTEKKSTKRGSHTGAAASRSVTNQESSPVSLLRELTEDQKNLGDLGQRIDTEQQLAAAYGDWITFVSVREKSFLHEMFVSLFFAVLIAVCVLLANYGVQRFFAEVTAERRQLRTAQTLLLFFVQGVGILLILLVIFGVPSNLATVLALAGAGVTVAMKDFIVGFFGWFVLMGKNGIRAGDWVEINGVGGEVLTVGLLHTVILETGNWADAGHPTGRKVSFVNSFAIEGHYFNFSTAGQWLWDEIEVQIPENADPYATAEAIQKIVADETSANAQLAETEWRRVAHANRSFSAAPSMSIRPTGGGVNVVVRYITRAGDRHEVRSRIYRALVDLLHKKKIPDANTSVLASPPAR